MPPARTARPDPAGSMCPSVGPPLARATAISPAPRPGHAAARTRAEPGCDNWPVSPTGHRPDAPTRWAFSWPLTPACRARPRHARRSHGQALRPPGSVHVGSASLARGLGLSQVQFSLAVQALPRTQARVTRSTVKGRDWWTMWYLTRADWTAAPPSESDTASEEASERQPKRSAEIPGD